MPLHSFLKISKLGCYKNKGTKMTRIISGRIRVKTLKNEFKKNFGLTIRVYKENILVNNMATLASIRTTNITGGELSCEKTEIINDLYNRFRETLGIVIEIAGSDDSYLCDNNMTLATAMENDIKKNALKKQKNKNNLKNVNITQYDTTPTDFKDIEKIRDLTEQENKWLNHLWSLNKAPKDILLSRSFIYEAVKRRGNALKFAPKKFKNDREIVLAAVKNNGIALEYASDQFKNDKAIVRTAIKQFGCALEYASEKFKNDRNIAFIAVKRNGSALEYVSKELAQDKDVVLAAVQCDGSALEYASVELRRDKNIVLAATEQWAWASKFVS